MKKTMAFTLVALMFVMVATAVSAPQAEIVVTGNTDFVEMGVSGNSTLEQGVLPAVLPRIKMISANRLAEMELVYPAGLFADTTAPVISDVQVEQVDNTTVRVSWTTDEFATSTVRYGTETDVYPDQVSEGLYVKVHEVLVTNLTPETAYYFVAGSTDVSGNYAESDEVPLVTQTEFFVFLPAVTN